VVSQQLEGPQVDLEALFYTSSISMFIYLAAASILVTIIAFFLDQGYGERPIIRSISTLLAKANLFSHSHDNHVGGHPSPINSRRRFQENVEEDEDDEGHEQGEEVVEEEDERKEEEKLKRVRSHLGIMMTMFLVGAMVVLVVFFIVALYYKDEHLVVQSSAQPDDRRKRDWVSSINNRVRFEVLGFQENIRERNHSCLDYFSIDAPSPWANASFYVTDEGHCISDLYYTHSKRLDTSTLSIHYNPPPPRAIPHGHYYATPVYIQAIRYSVLATSDNITQAHKDCSSFPGMQQQQEGKGLHRVLPHRRTPFALQ